MWRQFFAPPFAMHGLRSFRSWFAQWGSLIYFFGNHLGKECSRRKGLSSEINRSDFFPNIKRLSCAISARRYAFSFCTQLFLVGIILFLLRCSLSLKVGIFLDSAKLFSTILYRFLYRILRNFIPCSTHVSWVQLIVNLVLSPDVLMTS